MKQTIRFGIFETNSSSSHSLSLISLKYNLRLKPGYTQKDFWVAQKNLGSEHGAYKTFLLTKLEKINYCEDFLVYLDHTVNEIHCMDYLKRVKELLSSDTTFDSYFFCYDRCLKSPNYKLSTDEFGGDSHTVISNAEDFFGDYKNIEVTAQKIKNIVLDPDIGIMITTHVDF